MTRMMSYWQHRQTFSRKTSWRLAEQNELGDKVVLILALLVLAWFAGSAVYTAIEENRENAVQHAVKKVEAKTTKLEAVLISCLNRRPISVNGEAFECKTAPLGVRL